MNQLNTYLAHYEIERRLRAVDHHRRIRRGLARRNAGRTMLAGCIER